MGDWTIIPTPALRTTLTRDVPVNSFVLFFNVFVLTLVQGRKSRDVGRKGQKRGILGVLRRSYKDKHG